MATKAVTDASFAADVLQSDKPVLVDFWAEWCGPCKMIGPSLEEISEELGDKVSIVKMDIMESTDTPAKFGVQSIPLMVLFKNGQPVAQKLARHPRASSRRGSKASFRTLPIARPARATAPGWLRRSARAGAPHQPGTAARRAAPPCRQPR